YSAPHKRRPPFFAVPDIDSKPSLVGGHHRARLRLQDSGKHDLSAGPDPCGKKWCEQLQRIGQNIGKHDIVQARVERSWRIEPGGDFVLSRVVATGRDCLDVDVDAVDA